MKDGTSREIREFYGNKLFHFILIKYLTQCKTSCILGSSTIIGYTEKVTVSDKIVALMDSRFLFVERFVIIRQIDKQLDLHCAYEILLQLTSKQVM